MLSFETGSVEASRAILSATRCCDLNGLFRTKKIISSITRAYGFHRVPAGVGRLHNECFQIVQDHRELWFGGVAD